MAPRIENKLKNLINSGQLAIRGGRVLTYRHSDAAADVVFRERNTGTEFTFRAARVVNCTGPRSDMDRLAFPILADLRRRGLILPDDLGLGIETDDCAALDSAGQVSPWLYALGPLTRHSWWEVIAVPEINAQIDRLVRKLSAPERVTTHGS
jgi:uncharacterized NAD(P)/FAD-binding protein YdhS